MNLVGDAVDKKARVGLGTAQGRPCLMQSRQPSRFERMEALRERLRARLLQKKQTEGVDNGTKSAMDRDGHQSEGAGEERGNPKSRQHSGPSDQGEDRARGCEESRDAHRGPPWHERGRTAEDDKSEVRQHMALGPSARGEQLVSGYAMKESRPTGDSRKSKTVQEDEAE